MDKKQCSGLEDNLSQHDKDILDRIFNPNFSYDDLGDQAITEEQSEQDVPETSEEIEAKHLETEGVKAAESGNVVSALEHINKAIDLLPERASGYNNRAQALRLVNDSDGAMADLNKAVELSGGKGNSACQAFTQRGLLLKLQGKDDEALEDFKKAADLGGPFAKQMVITLNPYAALCNQMMAEVMSKLQKGET